MIGAADASPLHCGLGCSHARLWLRNEKRDNGCAAAAAASFLGDALEAPKALL
jgi:hypothetical protein